MLRRIIGVAGVRDPHFHLGLSTEATFSARASMMHDKPEEACLSPDLSAIQHDKAVSVEERKVAVSSAGLTRQARTTRTIPPFIASHDIPRGALYAFQALLMYALMLAVMCVATDVSR